MSKAFKELAEADPKASKRDIIDALWPEYEKPGRTKQSFKDSTDVNKLLAKAQKLGSISHLEKHGAFYGDFANAPKDLFEAREMLDRGKAIFEELPSEVRKDFGNDAVQFFNWAGGKSEAELAAELPQIAKPGSYFPDVSAATPPGALLGEGASEPLASVSKAGVDTPAVNSGSPDMGDSGASSDV